MLGLAVSPDNRTAAAFTSINQVVVLDVMLGTFRSVFSSPHQRSGLRIMMTLLGTRFFMIISVLVSDLDC